MKTSPFLILKKRLFFNWLHQVPALDAGVPRVYTYNRRKKSSSKRGDNDADHKLKRDNEAYGYRCALYRSERARKGKLRPGAYLRLHKHPRRGDGQRARWHARSSRAWVTGT